MLGSRQAAFLLLPIAMVLSANVPHEIDTELGCNNRPGVAEGELPQFFWALDGESVERTVLETGDLDTVVAAEVICWEAAERLFGVRVRNGGYSMWTAPGPYAALETASKRLIVAQEVYFADYDRYSGEVDQLSLAKGDPAITIDLTATGTGWTAALDYKRLNRLCQVFVGSIAAPRPDMTEGELECVSLHRHRME